MAYQPSPVRGPEEAVARSETHINEYLFRGGPDTETEDVEVAEQFGVGDLVKAAWADAKEMQEAWEEHAKTPVKEAESFSFLSQTQPMITGGVLEVVKPKPDPGPQLAPKVEQPREAGAEPQPESRAGVPHSLGSERPLTMAIL